MWDVLILIYLINATLLINHEIDSAYWREWDLFGLPGGITGFILLHLPLIFILLWGLLLIKDRSLWGLVISIVTGLGGFFGFVIHVYFLKKGYPEFRTFVSIGLLAGILILSLAQVGVSLYVAWGV